MIAVSGKTGTGDKHFDTYGAGGRLIGSRVVNRSATFVFNIDERLFGVTIVYVPVQLLKVLAPKLMPLDSASTGSSAQLISCVN